MQYAATACVDLLTSPEVKVGTANVGVPEENGYAKRLMRMIKEEEVALSEYKDLADAWRQSGRFLVDAYNTKRIHSSLDYLTPEGFASEHREKHSASA